MVASASALLPVYQPFPVSFVRGEGVRLFDEAGGSYLDFCAGLAVASLGHAHPHLVSALREQAGALWHSSNLYRNPQQEALAQRLCAASGMDYVFFCNSGAEAVEGAVKTARRWHIHHGRPEKTRILAFEGSFHGRTLTGLAASGKGEGFAPVLGGFDHAEFGSRDSVEAALTKETGAILVEPVQGEGGVNMPPAGWLGFLRNLCDRHGMLLVLDEVQTGIGRCGHFFAYQADGVQPDIIAVAKGLGGGFPVGAVLARAEAAAGMTTGQHGSTFGGNPLACAAASAVLDIVLEPDFLEQVRMRGRSLAQKLGELAAAHPDLIGEVRGAGLLWGLALKKPVRPLAELCLKEGLLVPPAGGDVLRLAPPLIISEADIDDALARLDSACTLYARDGGEA